MCLLCCGGCAFLGYKTNKALDKAFTPKEEPAESYWKTELKHHLKVNSIKKGSSSQSEDYVPSTRKMSAKEMESRDRLQRLIDAHAPSRKEKKKSK